MAVARAVGRRAAPLPASGDGVWHGCKVFGKRLIEQGTPAAIYTTGSENSFFVAVPQSAAYVASKHAVYGLTEAFAEEMPEYVKVGLITPGFVGSELIPEGGRQLAMPPDEFASIADGSWFDGEVSGMEAYVLVKYMAALWMSSVARRGNSTG